jgi:hypothetical protein
MLGSAKILPVVLRASLTLRSGTRKMRDWEQVAVDADGDTFFGHPPWHRATYENTVSVAVARLGCPAGRCRLKM